MQYLEVPVIDKTGLARYVLPVIPDNIYHLKINKVDSNVIKGILPMRRVIDELWIGDSIRSCTFSLNQWHAELGAWVFELRVFPLGQATKPDSFVVYVDVIDIPEGQRRFAKMTITLFVKTLRQKIQLSDMQYKYFNIDIPGDRYVRLDVPLSEIRYRNELAVTVQIDLEDSENPNRIGTRRPSKLQRFLSFFRKKRESERKFNLIISYKFINSSNNESLFRTAGQRTHFRTFQKKKKRNNLSMSPSVSYPLIYPSVHITNSKSFNYLKYSPFSCFSFNNFNSTRHSS